MKYTTNKLSPPEVLHAKPKDKLYRLRDGGGLYCEVLPTGSRAWRYNYRFNGKQKTFTIGGYPEISLADARTIRNQAKKSVSAGFDPSKKKQLQKNSIKEDSFQKIAEGYLAHNKKEWSEAHYKRTKSYLKRDVYPWIGDHSIQLITVSDITPLILKISDRGAVDAAKRVKGFIKQIFDFAVAHGKISTNLVKMIDLKEQLPKRRKKHFASIKVKDVNVLQELLRTIDNYHGTIVVRQALKLVSIVMVRPSELAGAEWSEINFDEKMWTIPAKRLKLLTHIKRENRPEDAHLVPLSLQAEGILREIHQYTGRGKYVFPSARGGSRTMSNNTLRVALRTMGFDKDTITTHGFRGVASTFLNVMKYRKDVIEAQLAHKEPNDVRDAYNHAEYIEERTMMLQDWADYLDLLKSDIEAAKCKLQERIEK